MRAHVRQENGFGLVELLMAMVILNIGLLAIVAAFNSGIIALSRAGRVTTASVLADGQMELYRAIRWNDIRLETAEAATADSDATYRDDTARQYPTALVTGVCSPLAAECTPRRSVTGADRRSYRIDTYIVSETPNAGGATPGRPVKKVTVVVRDGSDPAKTYARQVSTFDQSAG